VGVRPELGAPSEMGPGTGERLVMGHVWGPPSERGPGTGDGGARLGFTLGDGACCSHTLGTGARLGSTLGDGAGRGQTVGEQTGCLRGVSCGGIIARGSGGV
jgi:hypothetical protein